MKISLALVVCFLTGTCYGVSGVVTSVTCGDSNVTIVVDDSDFGTANTQTHTFVIAPEKLISFQLTPDADFCAPTAVHANGVDFTFDIGECFPVVTETADDIIYTYRIWALQNVNQTLDILRYEDSCLNATCTYPNNGNITAAESVNPLISKVSFPEISGNGVFDLTFSLFQFKNDTDEEAFPMGQVMVPDYIYGEIEDNVVTDNFILQAITCWASPTSDPSMDTSYPIIADGCAADNSFDSGDSIEVLQNFNQTIRFRFRSFTWTNFTDANQNIYVHCQVDFCDVTSGQDCVTNICNKRKRRSVETKNSHIISVGPMAVNTDLCSRDNGDCEELCNMIDGEKRCACLGDKIIGGDLHSCVGVDLFPQHLNENNWWAEDASMFAWLLVGVVIIVVIAAFYNKKI